MSLEVGDLAVLPTETVYGLAAHAHSKSGIDRIYALKGRSFDKPLAICVRDLAEAETMGVFTQAARDLAVKHWPGPLTLVLDAKDNAHLDPRTLGMMKGQKTIGLRCPDTDWRTELSGPLALTSANRSGEVDTTDLTQLDDDFFEHVMWTIEWPEGLSGKPSTIVRVSAEELTVLRQGELELSK